MSPETHSQLANFIWSICNLLRGPYKRNEYRKVILPLTVLRRFDCLLAPTKEKVLKEHPEIKDQARDRRAQPAREDYQDGLSITCPSWISPKLLDDPNQLAPNLNATSAVSRRTCATSWIVSRSTSRSRAWRRRIFSMKSSRLSVTEDRSTFRLSSSDNVQMGYVFEELIRIGAEQSNEEAGEHFTPREVIKLMVNLLLSPEQDLRRSHVVKTIYDPACGTGGMLSVARNTSGI